MVDRREFLRKLGKGAVYAAPVIHTLATPRDLQAIFTSGMFNMMWDMMPGMMGNSLVADPPWAAPAGPASPWTAPAPWSVPPAGPSSGSSGSEGS